MNVNVYPKRVVEIGFVVVLAVLAWMLGGDVATILMLVAGHVAGTALFSLLPADNAKNISSVFGLMLLGFLAYSYSGDNISNPMVPNYIMWMGVGLIFGVGFHYNDSDYNDSDYNDND